MSTFGQSMTAVNVTSKVKRLPTAVGASVVGKRTKSSALSLEKSPAWLSSTSVGDKAETTKRLTELLEALTL